MESDIALMRSIPTVRVFSPADASQTAQMVEKIGAELTTDYMRVTRADFPIFIDGTDIEIGEAQKLLNGTDVTIIATGSMVYESLMVARELIASGKSVDFLNIHTIKPLDGASIIQSASKTKKVVVIEEHAIE